MRLLSFLPPCAVVSISYLCSLERVTRASSNALPSRFAGEDRRAANVVVLASAKTRWSEGRRQTVKFAYWPDCEVLSMSGFGQVTGEKRLSR